MIQSTRLLKSESLFFSLSEKSKLSVLKLGQRFAIKQQCCAIKVKNVQGMQPKLAASSVGSTAVRALIFG